MDEESWSIVSGESSRVFDKFSDYEVNVCVLGFCISQPRFFNKKFFSANACNKSCLLFFLTVFSSVQFIVSPDQQSDDVSEAFTIISKAPSVYSVVSGKLDNVDFSVTPDEFSGGQKDENQETSLALKKFPKK